MRIRYGIMVGLLAAVFVAFFLLWGPAVLYRQHKEGALDLRVQNIRDVRYLCRLYYSRFAEYPYDRQGGEEALIQAVQRLFAQDDEAKDKNEVVLYSRILRGCRDPHTWSDATISPKTVGYVYLNVSDAHKLPGDTVLVLEKPCSTNKTELYVINIEGSVFRVAHEIEPHTVVGHSTGNLVREGRIVPYGKAPPSGNPSPRALKYD